MLKAKVGYSTNPESVLLGTECAKQSTKDFSNVKANFLYVSEYCDVKKVIKGVREINDAPIIGCTSSNGVLVPDGYITSETGFAGMMSFNDPNMIVGVAIKESGRDPRAIGRKVAIEAVENAKSTRAPSYFYMIASPKNEEDYLMGIQDVIGRIPCFGGSAADNNVRGNWKIFCNDKVVSDGVAVAFFYTDNEIVTSFSGEYEETENMGLITEVRNKRNLVSIDNVSSLKKYAHWINLSPTALKGDNLLRASITRPLGVKDPLGNLTVIRHPMFGEDNGTRTVNDDTILLGNNVVPGTAIIQLKASLDDLVVAPLKVLKDVKRQLYTEPAAYMLFHDGARLIALGNRIDDIAKAVIKEAKGVPFIMPFTFGEYGYDEHSANICGGLMLSFTAFGKD